MKKIILILCLVITFSIGCSKKDNLNNDLNAKQPGVSVTSKDKLSDSPKNVISIGKEELLSKVENRYKNIMDLLKKTYSVNVEYKKPTRYESVRYVQGKGEFIQVRTPMYKDSNNLEFTTLITGGYRNWADGMPSEGLESYTISIYGINNLDESCDVNKMPYVIDLCKIIEGDNNNIDFNKLNETVKRLRIKQKESTSEKDAVVDENYQDGNIIVGIAITDKTKSKHFGRNNIDIGFYQEHKLVK